MKKTFFQMGRYICVGVTATGVDYGSYYFFTRALSITGVIANPIAYMVGNVFSFVGHRLITFRSSGKTSTEYSRFFVVTIVGLLINQIVFILVYRLASNDLISKAFAIAVSGCFNYLSNRLWTFAQLHSS